ncbi:MAG TPA: MBL fold metallo-hydrolase [Rudaea sp.]|nr:MBL fold metallo-hydrolase [Rudaea sp.]
MDYGDGIGAIDTGFFRPIFDAAYLVVENGRAAFIDVGTNYAVPRILDALTQRNLDVGDVDYVILTHVHLDHAGGAGALMAKLPNARAVIHPRGAPHMIDPTRLIAGAQAVYGVEEIERSYGVLQPIDPSRVEVAADNHTVDLAGRPLLCIDSPGHARHHMVIHDAKSRSFFTGDTFGLSYREFDSKRGPFILPTTSPVQFEPDALHASIDRMLSFDPTQMFLTHFGRIEDVPRCADDLHTQIDRMVEIARTHAHEPDRHDRIKDALGALYVGRAMAHGSHLSSGDMRELLAMDIELNAQGLEIWLDRSAKP